jgi:hypothetical protein
LLPPSSRRYLPDEVASTSETSVNFWQTTLRNNPEGSHLHSLGLVVKRVSAYSEVVAYCVAFENVMPGKIFGHKDGENVVLRILHN